MGGSVWPRRLRGLALFAAGFFSAALLFVVFVVPPPGEASLPELTFSPSAQEVLRADLRTFELYVEHPLPAVSAQSAQEAPAHPGIQLGIRNILQLPELPNGCEATSIAIVLGYLGYPVDKVDVATSYLPKQAFTLGRWGYIGGDPEQVYPGSPLPDGGGYYCFPGVVVQTANAALDAQGADYAAVDETGATEEDLLALLDACIPVIVWHTTDNTLPLKSTENQWFLGDTDKLYTPYTNLHVSVLRGYDEDWFYFCDPLGEHAQLERPAFMAVFQVLGNRAVTVRGPLHETPAAPGESLDRDAPAPVAGVVAAQL